MTTSPLQALRSTWVGVRKDFDLIVGVGIDLVEVCQLEALIKAGGSSFLDLTWSQREQVEANGSTERLAARWAGKEAVMKALRVGLGDLEPLDIEIHSSLDGAPNVRLLGTADLVAREAGIDRCQVSISHEGGWAVAIAVAQRKDVESLSTQGRGPNE
jgi:holo-[acyl-carrier protein] synthase